MPSTINGIGTRYVSKSNLNAREAACSVCNRNCTLNSYDTRLWFVVLFIPVIPLKRKRIIDMCSLCEYHYAVDADEWEMSKQLNVSGALEKFREQSSVEAALEVHGNLCGFQQFKEATEFREAAIQEFPEDADLLAGFAIQMDSFGQVDDATEFYQQAYDLRPDLPEARLGVAFCPLYSREESTNLAL